MSSVDNLLRTVNEYMTDMFNTFGGQSTEYMNALQQYRNLLPEAALDMYARQGNDYPGDTPDAPLLLSRGKASQAAFEALKTDLEALRAAQRQAGTALVQAQKYLNEPDKPPEPDAKKPPKLQAKTREYIRQRARENYELSNNINDWYTTIMESEDITEPEKIMIKSYYSEINARYYDNEYMDEVKRAVMPLLERIEKAKKKRAAEKAEQAGDVTGVSVDADILK